MYIMYVYVCNNVHDTATPCTHFYPVFILFSSFPDSIHSCFTSIESLQTE